MADVADDTARLRLELSLARERVRHLEHLLALALDRLEAQRPPPWIETRD